MDSDDWVDEEALYKILDVLKTFEEKKAGGYAACQLCIRKEGMEHKKVIEYKNVLPTGRVFGWE